MQKDVLTWLQEWFYLNCNGKWEKEKRFIIESIDNPGWKIMLLLKDSKYENKIIKPIEIERTEQDWYHFLIENEEQKFLSAGGPCNLNEMLLLFKSWIENENKTIKDSKLINWLQKWYYQYCDGDWEHSERFRINTIDNPGWSFSINLEGTHCENKSFKTLEVEISESDWFHCFIREGKFEGRGGFLNLIDILKVFKEWVETS